MLDASIPVENFLFVSLFLIPKPLAIIGLSRTWPEGNLSLGGMVTVLNPPSPNTQFPLGALTSSSAVKLKPGIVKERSILPPVKAFRLFSTQFVPTFLS